MSNNRPYYCWLDVEEEDRIERIREQVWAALDPPKSAARSRPHVTVVPGFTCDDDAVQSVAEAMMLLPGRSATVEGVSFWPTLGSKEQPFVVTLQLDAPLEGIRGDIRQIVEESGGTIDKDPVPAHITLFKTGDSGDEGRPEPVSPHTRAMEAVEGVYGGWEITFSSIGVKERV